MDIKKIIKQELKEVSLSEVTGDKGATNIAAGEDALDRVKGRLQKLGVYAIPELDGIMTTEQLSIEPFEFDFVLQVPELQEEFNIPKPPKFSTLARVANDSPFTLEVKKDGDDTSFTIQFNEKEMITNLPGAKKNIRALKTESRSNKGKFYNVILSSDLLNVMKESSGGEGDGNKEGDEKKGEGGIDGEGGGKNSKEGVFNDLTGFFKFVVNNKKFLATKPNSGKTQESIFDDIEKLLLEADVNPTEDVPVETKSYEGRIYIKDIALGPKAKARRAGDIQGYSNKTGKGSTNWDGSINSLPEKGLPVKVNLVLDDESGLTDEQKKVFQQIVNTIGKASYNGSATIRRSKKIQDNTVFVIEFDNKALVCTVNQGQNLRKPSNIEIGPKAGGEDVFNKSTKAKILFS